MPALVCTFGADVAYLAIEFFNCGRWINSDQAERLFAHMAHSWLVVDVGEALALHKLKLLMLVPRYTLKKGALSIGTWGQVRGQLSVKLFEDVRLGRRWNVLNLFVLIPGALAVIA